MVLIYGDEQIWDGWSDEQGQANGEAHARFQAEFATAVVGGHELHRTTTATSLRADPTGRLTVTDGPFLDSKEVLGGYYLIDARDIDEAISLAGRLPEAIDPSSGVEVRPVKEST
jgi:hypothetical protein